MPEGKSNIIKGIAAAPGLTIADAFLYTKEIESVKDESIADVDEAKRNLIEALEKSKKELNKIFGLAVDKLGDKRAAIFEAQLMILEDEVLINTILGRIEKEKKTPEFIVSDEINKYQQIMNASTEAYMKERSQDIEDIKNRIVRNLKNKKWKSRIVKDVIVVAHSITPADTILFTRVNVKGYVTNLGGLTSHAAIVARSLNIPAVVGVHDATAKISDGDKLVIDGYHGKLIINPDDEQLAYYNEKIVKLNEYDSELVKLKDEKAVTTDGHEVKLMANLDVDSEIEYVMQNGANGIGLVRTEQIFQVLENFPDEEQQYIHYSKLAEKLYPEEVIIRTFDIGGDKVLPLDVKEPNPMLGWRGIRFLLDHEELFKTQLRAILKASRHNNIKVMIPMVSSISEVIESKELLEECKIELKKENVPFDNHISFGIMIEVPSAALMIHDFAEYVDFFSIGTNDLIQYLLAVDRGNDIVTDSYQEFHPAIVRALEFMVREAKATGKHISICGEMAADHLAVPLIVGIGFDSVSVNASSLPHIKSIIRKLSFSEVKSLCDEVLKLNTESAIKARITQFYNEHLTEEIEKIFEN